MATSWQYLVVYLLKYQLFLSETGPTWNTLLSPWQHMASSQNSFLQLTEAVQDDPQFLGEVFSNLWFEEYGEMGRTGPDPSPASISNVQLRFCVHLTPTPRGLHPSKAFCCWCSACVIKNNLSLAQRKRQTPNQRKQKIWRNIVAGCLFNVVHWV